LRAYQATRRLRHARTRGASRGQLPSRARASSEPRRRPSGPPGARREAPEGDSDQLVEEAIGLSLENSLELARRVGQGVRLAAFVRPERRAPDLQGEETAIEAARDLFGVRAARRAPGAQRSPRLDEAFEMGEPLAAGAGGERAGVTAVRRGAGVHAGEALPDGQPPPGHHVL
jgi:hypothetical protein